MAAVQIDPFDELREQAEVIRASGVLGKPGAVTRLFDFLLDRTVSGRAPKELEIAVEVFGKDAAFDVSQDSMVRVYVHKLRRRLEAFYARPGSPSTRIVIPKGQYRLTLEPTGSAVLPVTPALVMETETLDEPVAALRPRRWRAWMLAGFGAVAAAAIGAVMAWTLLGSASDRELRDVRNSAVWAPLLADDLPITIVVGDYYLLGETDGSDSIRRLVREFFINSPGDLLHQVEVNPQPMQHYRDVNLTYLPAASAFALEDVTAVLAAKRKKVRVRLMSQMDGATLKGTHVLYIGYISGMGMLGDAVFSGSRLSPGGSYDELIDTRSDRSYVSTAGQNDSEMSYTDYGYFSTFPGPDHNRVVVIAGTRDMGVMQMAEALTRPDELGTITREARGAAAFESLYEVYAVGKSNVQAKRLFVSDLRTGRIWAAR